MKARLLKSRLFRVLLVSFLLLLWVGASLGISALLFHFGEQEVYAFGSQYEYLDLQIALYHIREVEAEGDYVIVMNDTWRYFDIIPIAERLPHAISSLFTLHWSYATCMDNLPLLSVMGAALRGSLLALLFFLLAAGLAFLARFMPTVKAPRFVYPLIALPCLIIALLSPLWSSSLGWPIPFLSAGVFVLLLGQANKKGSISQYLLFSFLFVGAAWLLFHLLGLYTKLGEDAYSLSALLMQGVRGQDNHTYALSFLFLGILSIVPFAISSYIAVTRKKPVSAGKEAENA